MARTLCHEASKIWPCHQVKRKNIPHDFIDGISSADAGKHTPQEEQIVCTVIDNYQPLKTPKRLGGRQQRRRIHETEGREN